LVPALLVSIFGVVFLLTSAKMKVKKLVLWLFGISIVFHAAGISLRGRYTVLDDVLIVNGILMLLLIGFMCHAIFRRFGRKRRDNR
jgi:hypothetical protein